MCTAYLIILMFFLIIYNLRGEVNCHTKLTFFLIGRCKNLYEIPPRFKADVYSERFTCHRQSMVIAQLVSADGSSANGQPEK
jgi:hypothetical protein